MIGNIIAENPWEIARLGKFTSSKIDFLFTEPKTKEAKASGELSETAKSYILEKASEIITGTRREVSGAAIEWGNLYEPEAAAKLKEMYPMMEYMGKDGPRFFPYTDFSGGSPDAADFENRIVFEIKCPEDPKNHVRYSLIKSAAELKKMERDYYHQIQMNMACVAKEIGCDFMDMIAVFASYCPIVNKPYRELVLIDIHPDSEFIEKLPSVIEAAEERLAEIIWELKGSVIAEYDKETSSIIVQ